MILLNRDIRLLRLPALVIDKSAFVLTFLVALACFNRPSRLLLLHGRRLYAASASTGQTCLPAHCKPNNAPPAWLLLLLPGHYSDRLSSLHTVISHKNYKVSLHTSMLMSIYLKFFMNHAVNIGPIFGQKLHRWGKYSSFYSTHSFLNSFLSSIKKSWVNEKYICLIILF